MIEIGKRDFIGQGRLSMDRFEPNRSFFGIDLAHMYVERPKKIKRCVADDFSISHPFSPQLLSFT